MHDNPYAAPEATDLPATNLPQAVFQGEPAFASRGLRFLGFLIDRALIGLSSYFIVLFLVEYRLYNIDTHEWLDIIFIFSR